VPFGAGGSGDFIARLFGQKFQALTGTPVVIENKSGAGGSVGSAFVAKAMPDGYTLLLGTASTHAINPSLYADLPFDSETDFDPITPLVRLPNILVANRDLPVKSVPDLIAYLRANDGKLNYGSGGNGTSSHLSAVMFLRAIGVTMAHIPFRGTSDELAAMMGGQIQIAIDSMTTIWPIAKAGEVRPLAVTSVQRSSAAPNLPALGEIIPGYEAVGWQGLFAPHGTPRSIVEQLAATAKQILADPVTVESLESIGGQPFTMSPDEFTAFIRTERFRWAQIIKENGVRIE
jgi:tripartite-type tricarboxylate transporter receptor subunit TctC